MQPVAPSEHSAAHRPRTICLSLIYYSVFLSEVLPLAPLKRQESQRKLVTQQVLGRNARYTVYGRNDKDLAYGRDLSSTG